MYLFSDFHEKCGLAQQYGSAAVTGCLSLLERADIPADSIACAAAAGEGPGHREPHHLTHPGQSGAAAEAADVQGARPHQSCAPSCHSICIMLLQRTSCLDLASPAASPGTRHVRCWVCIEVCVLHMLSAESEMLAAQHTCLRPATLSSSSQRRWLQYLLDRWVFQSNSGLPNCKGASSHSKLLGCVLCCECAITEGRVVGRKSVPGNDLPSLSRGEQCWTASVLQQEDVQGWWPLLTGDCAVRRRM